VKSRKVVSKLKCWYDDRNQAYFRLMPIQVEQQSFDPVIYTFHNVLSDKEIDALKELAKPLVIPPQKINHDNCREINNSDDARSWLAQWCKVK